ncbi:MAG: hypothetical protein ACKO63_01160 [Nodosilinea sp.]
MNSGEIDRFPVSQLEGRYSLARSAVYKRMEQLGIAPQRLGKRAFITGQDLALMDELHAFINYQSGSAAEFIEARGLRRPPPVRGSVGNGGPPPENGAALAPTDLGSFVRSIVTEVFNGLAALPSGDQLNYFDRLEAAAQNGWLLSTTEVGDLLDLSPAEIEGSGDDFFEAGFIFRRSGYRKNGQVAWRVTKRLK